MLQNAYLLAKIGADTAENERNFAEISNFKFCQKSDLRAELRGAGGPRGAAAGLGRAGHLRAGLRRGRHAGERAAHGPASENWKSEIKTDRYFSRGRPWRGLHHFTPPKKTWGEVFSKAGALDF